MLKISSNINIDKLRISQFIIRFISSISVFALTVFFTPNFKIASFPILILSSITIILFDYLVSVVTGIHDIPLGRGIVGFTCAAIIIYITQFFCRGILYFNYKLTYSCSNIWRNRQHVAK